MSRKFQTLSALTLLSLGCLGNASAHWLDGHNYAAIELGSNRVSQQNLYQQGFNFVNIGFDNDFKVASARGISIGRSLDIGPRIELSYSRRSNDIQSFGNRLYDGGGVLTGEGSEKLNAWMANLWYDFDLKPFGLPIKPYIGAGLGRGRLEVKGLAAGGVSFGDASANVDVRQWGFGVSWDVSEALTLDLGHRRLLTSTGGFGSIPNIPPGNVEARYRAFTTQLGLRLKF